MKMPLAVILRYKWHLTVKQPYFQHSEVASLCKASIWERGNGGTSKTTGKGKHHRPRKREGQAAAWQCKGLKAAGSTAKNRGRLICPGGMEGGKVKGAGHKEKGLRYLPHPP